MTLGWFDQGARLASRRLRAARSAV